MPNIKKTGDFTATSKELAELFRPQDQPEGMPKVFLFMVGLILTPLTLAGALWGYVRGYNRFMRPMGRKPELHDLPSVVQISMLFGLILPNALIMRWKN